MTTSLSKMCRMVRIVRPNSQNQSTRYTWTKLISIYHMNYRPMHETLTKDWLYWVIVIFEGE